MSHSLKESAAVWAIVQARMSSSRFPGKVLYEVGGRCLLAYLLERLQAVGFGERLVVATSQEREDDAVASFCERFGVSCFRGSLHDVAGRFLALVRQENMEGFVRVCADSPLLDGALITQGLRLFAESGADVATNTFPKSFPMGQSVEVVRAKAFERACARMTEEADREHVTRYLYRHPQDFRLCNFTCPQPWAHWRLGVDTPEDMERFRKLVAAMTRPHTTYALSEMVEMAEAL